MNSQQRLHRRLSTLKQHSPTVNDDPKLKKLLVKVNIQGSFGPVHVLMSSEDAVEELTKKAIDIYKKEMRRPLLKETNPRRFDLHYSPFCLESLEADEKLINLESRNFYMCLKPVTAVATTTASSSSSCSDETRNAAESVTTILPLTRLFMGLLL